MMEDLQHGGRKAMLTWMLNAPGDIMLVKKQKKKPSQHLPLYMVSF